jgi:hypothetical protein
VEAIVRVLQRFPKCHGLQCCALRDLVDCSIGKEKAIESGGIKVLLAAVNNHLVSAYGCVDICWALTYLVQGSKAHTELLIGLGGCATVAEVRNEWLDDDEVQTKVLFLTKLLAVEMNSWIVEE